MMLINLPFWKSGMQKPFLQGWITSVYCPLLMMFRHLFTFLFSPLWVVLHHTPPLIHTVDIM
jgi:hypothetical protein